MQWRGPYHALMAQSETNSGSEDGGRQLLLSSSTRSECEPPGLAAACRGTGMGISQKSFKQTPRLNCQRGDHKEAGRQIDAALKVNPKLVGAHETRGVGLQKLHRFAEAASYDRAIALAPYDASTFLNRSNALQELKHSMKAVVSYDRAITLRPDYAAAFYNRGNVLHVRRRNGEALASYDQAIRLKPEPDYADAFNNRGTLQGLKRFDEALRCS